MLKLKFLLLILFSLLINSYGEDLSKVWTFTCRSEYCKEGLDTFISSNCLGN